jgi:addiction module HigA family antidote
MGESSGAWRIDQPTRSQALLPAPKVEARKRRWGENRVPAYISATASFYKPATMSSLGFSIHPGEILREEYLAHLGLKPYTLAKRLGIPRTRIERLVAEKTPVTPDTALRLAKFFDTTPQFWMNMQTAHDLATEAEAKKDEIAAIDHYAEARLAA